MIMSFRDMSEKKKVILIVGSSLLLFIGIIVLGVVLQLSHNPYGERLVIQNLGTYTSGKPSDKDRINFIEHSLFQTVNLNSSSPVGDRSIKDIYIRDNSFSQTNTNGVHTVSFLVDSASIEQSYRISYEWLSDESGVLDEWGTGVFCVDASDVIYDTFSCSDLITGISHPSDSTLGSILPHETNYYLIDYYIDDNGKAIISIKIMSNNNSSSTSRFFSQYETTAIEWLKQSGVAIGDYEIVVRNLSGEIVKTYEAK